MYPWGDTRNTGHIAGAIPGNEPARADAAPYAAGDTICSGGCRGTVVTVDAEKATMGVVWADSDDEKPITYPMDADYLSKRLPWQHTQ